MVNKAHNSPTGSAPRWVKGGVNVGQHYFRVHVIPNSKRFEIGGYDPWRDAIKIKVKSPAEEGKANRELIKELKNLLGHEVMIKSGHRKRDKVIVVFCEDQEWPQIRKKLKLDE